MNHQGTKRMETDRLVLRRFVMEDAAEMYRNWASEDAVTQYLTWPTHPDVEETRAVLNQWISHYESPDFYNWGIQLKATGELIGNLSVVRVREEICTATIGWCMGTRWWGQGIMPESARALLAYLFEEVGFHRVEAAHDANNPKSGRVMQKIGMTYEGTWRRAGRDNAGIMDEVWYSILKEEYEEKK